MNVPFYRSKSDKWIAGVIGGLSRYWSLNATVIRIIAIIAALAMLFVPLGLTFLLISIVIYIYLCKKTPFYEDAIQETESDDMKQTGTQMTELTIDSILQGIQYYAGTSDESPLLEMAGQAYLKGIYGANKDYEKAINFFRRYEVLEPVDGAYKTGLALIASGLETNQKSHFTEGILSVYKSYCNGHSEAKEYLTHIAEEKMFKNVSTFDELIRLIEGLQKQKQ